MNIIVRGYYKTNSHVWLESLDDDQSNRNKLKDFQEQSMKENLWTQHE